MQLGGGDNEDPQKKEDSGWTVTWKGVTGIVRELVDSPIFIIVTLVSAAATITHHVDGIAKEQAVQAKEIQIWELRAQNDLGKCLMDMGYGSEYASWREKEWNNQVEVQVWTPFSYHPTHASINHS